MVLFNATSKYLTIEYQTMAQMCFTFVKVYLLAMSVRSGKHERDRFIPLSYRVPHFVFLIVRIMSYKHNIINENVRLLAV